MPRRDQDLALQTWKLVESVPDEVKAQFRSRAMGLGAMLQGSGLAATAAFLQAKAGATLLQAKGGKTVPHAEAGEGGSLERAYAALAKGLEQYVRSVVAVPGGDARGFIRRIGEADPSEYRRMSAAANEFAIWIRRAAEALIPAMEDR